MTKQQFRNALCLIHNVDSFDLGDPLWWTNFRDNPIEFFLRSDDERSELIWQAMKQKGTIE